MAFISIDKHVGHGAMTFREYRQIRRQAYKICQQEYEQGYRTKPTPQDIKQKIRWLTLQNESREDALLAVTYDNICKARKRILK